MARKPRAGRKIFLWQESPVPGGRFFCGKRVLYLAEDFFVARKPRTGRKIFCGKKTLRRAEDFFVVRESRTGRKIFLWQESPEPGAGFDKTYNFFNFFFPVSPFSFLSLPFPFLRSPFFLFFRSPLSSLFFPAFFYILFSALMKNSFAGTKAPAW